MHVETVLPSITKTAVATFSDNAMLKFLGAGIAGLAGTLTNGNEQIVTAIFTLYVIDLITGALKALKRREFQSGKFFKGATKLLVYGVFLWVAVAIDTAIGYGRSFSWAMMFYIVLTDAISIIENLDALGFETPDWIRRYLLDAKKNPLDALKKRK